MSELFRAKGYAPGGFVMNSKQEVMEMAALPPFLRTLLVTDGTVTKSLEAYFWEVVNVENLGQQELTVEEAIERLNITPGDSALRREVRLVGADSGTAFVYARSLLRLNLLPEDLRAQIRAGKIGIGELLRECGLETFRELLDFGTEPAGALAEVLGVAADDELVYRVYRISFHQEPMILVTEKFPRAIYEHAP